MAGSQISHSLNETGNFDDDEQQTRIAETVDRPPTLEDGIRPPKIYEPFSLPVLVLLMPASIFGVLSRLGLQALTTFDGRSIFPLAYVQAVGCLIMGMGMRVKEPLGQFYGPLYTALTTGFCGSLTTFSGWQLDIFNSWINSGKFHRGGLQDFINGVGVSAITLSLSLASLSFGYHIASILETRLSSPSFLKPLYRYSLSVTAVLTYAATFLTYFLLADKFRHQATAALLFSFPGTLTRYTLSVMLNSRFKALPVGTLAANSLGTALLATFHVLQSTMPPPSANTCSILQGLIDGYCGCLTTVSTFAAEVHTLRDWKAFRYVIVSCLTGQGLMLVIFGTSIWTGRASEQVTCKFIEA